MTYDEALAQFFRDELDGVDGVTEKRMFGGLCFLLNGNMLCGVHKGGGMARVGKALEEEALQLDGVDPLSFTGRKMGGMIEMTFQAVKDQQTRRAVMALALEFVETLPAK